MKRNDSSQMTAVIAPINGCREAIRRKGLKPKNHHSVNLTYIKSLGTLKKPEKKPPTRAKSIPSTSKNFITSNISDIKTFKYPNSTDIEESSEVLRPYGYVPNYISTIKNTLADTKAKM